MFAATRVMAAGKAGLESLPYFVDELLAQGITQLAPWAVDHNQEQIDRLNEATRERRGGPWRKLHGLGGSDLGLLMQPDMAASHRLLRDINPHAADTGLADSPAELAVWCRLLIGDACRDTLNLWERFKHQNGIARRQQLAVVIPFCPEGPTSGTVGLYLGAALRKHFADAGKANELVVWGIEMCPAVDPGEPDALAVQNALRGYVGREELLHGVPLSKDDPNDQQNHQPFDINIVIDGGATLPVHEEVTEEDIWTALDRVAAQTTACLLNGAAGGDVDESTNWLKQGKRWNAYLAHVTSELSYSKACRYLRYRVNLPWHRDSKLWNDSSPADKKEGVLRRINEDIRPMLQREKDSRVRGSIEYLVQLAEPLKDIKNSKLLIFPNKTAINKKLDQIIAAEQGIYQGICEEDDIPNRVIPKTDPFCINIGLPEQLRQEANEKWRDNGRPDPLGDVLGVNGALTVRNKIEDLLSLVLKRNDYNVQDNSQADFEQIIGISIEDRSRENLDNEEFRPGKEFLRDFINVSKRTSPSSLNELKYNLSEYLQPSATHDAGRGVQSRALGWRLPRHGDYDIPVEYSFLALARCRRSDGFKDVSTYAALKTHYDRITADPDAWREYARYYGVKPPNKMEEGCPDHPEALASANSDGAHNIPEDESNPNGYRTILSARTENS